MARAATRQQKTKMNICKPPAELIFQDADAFTYKSVYRTKLREALEAEGAIEILGNDKYVLNMFKAAAKKMHLRLVFATKGDSLYLKPLALGEHQRRLALYLRESRSFSWLESVTPKLEVDLRYTLGDWIKKKLITKTGENYILTAEGQKALVVVSL